MAISAWLVLAGVSQIFPCDQDTTPGSDPDQQQESST